MNKESEHFWKYHNKADMDVHAVRLIGHLEAEIEKQNTLLENIEKQVKRLEENNKTQKEIIKIDVQMFEDIRDEYPNTKDLQAKISDRDKKVEQTLKGDD